METLISKDITKKVLQNEEPRFQVLAEHDHEVYSQADEIYANARARRSAPACPQERVSSEPGSLFDFVED